MIIYQKWNIEIRDGNESLQMGQNIFEGAFIFDCTYVFKDIFSTF